MNSIDPRIFRHCSNGQECRDHISSQADSSKWNKHLFLPDFETELGEHAIPGLSDTLFYLYCHGQHSVDLNKQKFQKRALNRIFTVDDLPFYLYGAGIELLHKLLRNKPNGINEREYDDLVLIVEYCTGTTFRTRTLPVQKFSTRNPTRTRSFATRTLPAPVALLPVPCPYP